MEVSADALTARIARRVVGAALAALAAGGLIAASAGAAAPAGTITARIGVGAEGAPVQFAGGQVWVSPGTACSASRRAPTAWSAAPCGSPVSPRDPRRGLLPGGPVRPVGRSRAALGLRGVQGLPDRPPAGDRDRDHPARKEGQRLRAGRRRQRRQRLCAPRCGGQARAEGAAGRSPRPLQRPHPGGRIPLSPRGAQERGQPAGAPDGRHPVELRVRPGPPAHPAGPPRVEGPLGVRGDPGSGTDPGRRLDAGQCQRGPGQPLHVHVRRKRPPHDRAAAHGPDPWARVPVGGRLGSPPSPGSTGARRRARRPSAPRSSTGPIPTPARSRATRSGFRRAPP